MKCNICGNNVADNTVFCPYCGSAIKRQEENNMPVGNQNIVNESVAVSTVQNVNVTPEISSNDSVNFNQNNMYNQNIVSGSVTNEPTVEQNFNTPNTNTEVNSWMSVGNSQNNPINQNNNVNNLEGYQTITTNLGNNINTNNNVYTNSPMVDPVFNDDKVNIGLAILSWFIPLVGIIFFFTKKKTSPKTSKVCGIVALIAIIFSSLILIFTGIVLKNAFDDINSSNGISEDYEDEISSSNSAIWKSYEVQINNKKIKLPCSYKDYVEITNFQMKAEKENITIKNYYYDILNVYSEEKLAGTINIYNKSGEDLLYKDANVSRISQTHYNVKVNNVSKIKFPGNLYVGKTITKDKVIKLLGTPTKESEMEYNGIKTYQLKYSDGNEYATSKYYEIIIVDDYINELSLDNRP